MCDGWVKLGSSTALVTWSEGPAAGKLMAMGEQMRWGNPYSGGRCMAAAGAFAGTEAADVACTVHGVNETRRMT